MKIFFYFILFVFLFSEEELNKESFLPPISQTPSSESKLTIPPYTSKSSFSCGAAFSYLKPGEPGIPRPAEIIHNAEEWECLTLDYKYKPAFSLYFNKSLSRKNLSLQFDYNWVKGTAKYSGNFDDVRYGFYHFSGIGSDFFYNTQLNSLLSKWKYHLNSFTLSFLNTYKISGVVQIQSLLGIFFFKLSQSLYGQSDFQPISISSTIHSGDNWSAGPKCGIKISWDILNKFFMLTDLSISLGYQHLVRKEVTGDYFSSTPPYTRIWYTQSPRTFNSMNAVFDSFIGIKWEKSFFDLEIGYLFNIFFNQNIFKGDITRSFDFSLEGGKVKLNFKF